MITLSVGHSLLNGSNPTNPVAQGKTHDFVASLIAKSQMSDSSERSKFADLYANAREGLERREDERAVKWGVGPQRAQVPEQTAPVLIASIPNLEEIIIDDTAGDMDFGEIRGQQQAILAEFSQKRKAGPLPADSHESSLKRVGVPSAYFTRPTESNYVRNNLIRQRISNLFNPVFRF